MSAPSLDLLVERALSVRQDEDRWTAALAGLDVEAPRPRDPAPFLAAWPKAEGPVRTLLAEAALLAGTARPRRAERTLRATPLPRLGVRRDGAMRGLRLEGDAARRSAIHEALGQAEDAGRPAAVEVVRSLRAGLGALGQGTTFEAIGWGHLGLRATAEAVLAATEDPWRELARHRGRVVLGRIPGTLADLAALLRAPAADRALPLADRAGIASRWATKAGLALPSVGPLPPPSADGPPPRAVVPDAAQRLRIVFAPAPDAHGVLELAELVGALLAAPEAARDPSITAHRLGATRLAVPLGGTLARRLLLAPSFLVREAGVDRSVAPACLRELLFVELVRLREAAMQGLALALSLDREGGLGERIADLFARALGVPLAPARAPQHVAEAFEDAAPARLEAALAEAALEARLVAEHDEDWFRNPRAGSAIERGFVLAGALGTAEGASDAGEALAARRAELDARLRRWWRDAGA